MTSPEKFCLKWNDFRENIAETSRALREDLHFSDVTLVCEEDHQIEAHRVILSACSPFFSSILKKNKHSHPMIYMRGLKSKDLIAIVDFIYHGEANIYQEDLDGFLVLAEELQLKGLVGSNKGNFDKTEPSDIVPTMNPNAAQFPKEEIISNNTEEFQEYSVKKYDNLLETTANTYKIVVPFDSNMTELDSKLNSMMESINFEGFIKWRCTVCGKMAKKADTRRHVESHLEGNTHPCNICGKVSRSLMGLTNHMSRFHRK